MSVDMVELSVTTPKPVKRAEILQKNRLFLDFFWDLAKPEQEIRLKALENLIQYLKTNDQADELEYSLKRLVDGLGHTREAARPAFSLALGQVLGAFKHISLQIVFDQIKAKHNLQTVPKKFFRNAAFGNLFGVLALHQSGRISELPEVVLGSVELLQSLSNHRHHLKDLPTQTMTDILNEIPEEVFEEVLLSALQTDLASAFSTPEQLQLLLVALRRFPRTLKPKKLKNLLGFSTIINADNIPKLTEVLKMAAQSSKKDCLLPRVVLDLLKLSLTEGSFQLFWDDAIINGMLLKQPAGPAHYMSFRLLGSALPLLSEAQLKVVLSGEVMTYYAEHVASSQKGSRFKLAPEMEAYVLAFLQGCQDADRQLAVIEAFSLLSSNGLQVTSPTWRVVQHLQPAAVQQYVEWLKNMFLQPQLDKLLDLGASKQKDDKDVKGRKENSIFSLRRWIVSRLCSIIDNHQVKKEEGIIMGVARFIFFHAFFVVKKASQDIEETLGKLSVPLDNKIGGPLVSSFFGLLLSLHHMPLDKDPAEGAAPNRRRVLGITTDGTLWIYHMAQYAQLLLSQPKYAQCSKPFTAAQTQAWDSMLESVATLRKKEKKGPTPGSGAFQQLFLLVGLHLFTAPEELVDIMKDLQSCVDKALEKNAKKKKKKKPGQEEEPGWVDVMVEILLSLLSQQSRHIRLVCKTVFSSICPDITKAALTAILDVLDPEKDEDGALVVTLDNKAQKKNPDEEDVDDEMEGNKSGDDSDDAMEEGDDDDDDDDDDEEGDDEEEMVEGNVDQHFRMELMKVLHGKNALPTGEDGSSDEEMDDDAMMALDEGLSTLFSAHKKNAEAKKDEKTKIQKEKMLVRDFKMKVLDLVEVFVTRQASSPLVLCLVEPLLNIIHRGMSSANDQQEQDFLRRVADIFRNQLCRSKAYCRTASDRKGELHDLLDKLMTKTQKLSESSVGLYYFSASLYVVKVLRGAPPPEAKKEQTAGGAAAENLSFMGNVDVDRVAAIFKGALSTFMGKRKSPLSAQMFTDLFNKFPVLCVKLLDTLVQHITSAVRVHQQGQACLLMLQAMQSREVQQLLSGAPWTELCASVSAQLVVSLQQVSAIENKEGKEKILKTMELCHFLLRSIERQALAVDLEPLQEVLQSLTSKIAFKGTSKLEDTYWAVAKHFGIQKPKFGKTKPNKEADLPQSPQKKKKGFLPETKKRKKRENPILEPAAAAAAAEAGQATSGIRPGADKGQVKKKHDKKTKQKRPADGAAEASQPNAAKRSKTTQSESKADKKKKKKKKPKQKKEEGGKM